MFKIRTVLFLMIAALVTGVVEVVGLHRAAQLWNASAATTPCPAPPAVSDAPDFPASPPEPAPPAPDGRAHRIGWMSLAADVLAMDVDGRRRELSGYPAPRSTDHAPPRLTTVVFAPDGAQLALAGECVGQSGAAHPIVPSCARQFVRLYRVEDGAHVRDLRTSWNVGIDDERRVLAMRFDARGERLAVLIASAWSDCSWSGRAVELVVYRLADGARLLHRDLEAPEVEGVREMRFDDDEVRVWLAAPNGRPKRHIVRLRRAKAA